MWILQRDSADTRGRPIRSMLGIPGRGGAPDRKAPQPMQERNRTTSTGCRRVPARLGAVKFAPACSVGTQAAIKQYKFPFGRNRTTFAYGRRFLGHNTTKMI